MNIDAKNIILLSLESPALRLSKGSKIISLASIFAKLPSSVDDFIKVLKIYL